MRLIDADELKIDFGFTWDDITPTREEMFEIIDRQPTVEPKTGRWEMKTDPYGFFDDIPVCSECGCTTKMREVYKFCPNCGARMKGRKE